MNEKEKQEFKLHCIQIALDIYSKTPHIESSPVALMSEVLNMAEAIYNWTEK